MAGAPAALWDETSGRSYGGVSRSQKSLRIRSDFCIGGRALSFSLVAPPRFRGFFRGETRRCGPRVSGQIGRSSKDFWRRADSTFASPSHVLVQLVTRRRNVEPVWRPNFMASDLPIFRSSCEKIWGLTERLRFRRSTARGGQNDKARRPRVEAAPR